MKKIVGLSMLLFLLSSGLTSCHSKYDVNVKNVPWEIKMEINYYGDRSLMVEFTNNSDFTITELSIEFSLKDNNKDKDMESFYSYMVSNYDLDKDDENKLRTEGISMSAWAYLDEDEYLKKGEKIEESLNFGWYFIKTMDYVDLFQPDMYAISYLDVSGEEKTIYYDYINKEYTLH